MNKENKRVLRLLTKKLLDQVPSISHSEIVKKLIDYGYARSTAYDTVSRMVITGKVEDEPRSGAPRKIKDSIREKIINNAVNRIGTSRRKLGQKFQVSPSSIGIILKENNINYRKRQRCPDYSEKQRESIPKLARRLHRNYVKPGISVIMDDKKYFPFYCNDGPEFSGFYTNDISSTPEEIKFKKRPNFKRKFLFGSLFQREESVHRSSSLRPTFLSIRKII